MENESIKVSVIVPVYNVQKYISDCVQSIVGQDYHNIEIILVDDGSPDNCPQIIDQLAATDGRISVIHKANGGVSSARNAGIIKASGEYIMFVDGDDWVDADYVSYFLSLVKTYHCDIGMNKNNYHTGKTKSTDNIYSVSAEKAIEWIYSDEIFVAVWNKIYSRKLITDFYIKFNEEIWYGEGMLFNIECLQRVDAVAIGEKAVYHQTFNPDSAMRKFNLESNLCGIRSLEIQKQKWEKMNKAIEAEWRFHRYRFNRSIASGLLRSNLVDTHKVLYRMCIKNIRKEILLPMKMEKSFKARIGWIFYFISPGLMARRGLGKLGKPRGV